MLRKAINWAGAVSTSIFVGMLIGALRLKSELVSTKMIEMDWSDFLIWSNNMAVYQDVMITSLIGIIVTAIIMVYANMSCIVRRQRRP